MVNQVSNQHNNANPALYAATAGQRPPPQLRTETPPETQRPVPPTQGARAQNAEDRVSISRQGQSLAADDSDNENFEAASGNAPGDGAGRDVRSGLDSGIEKYSAVKAMVNS